MSIEKSIDKVVEENVAQLTKGFDTFIPENIIELIIGYFVSFVLALLIFFIGKWISKSLVHLMGRALRRVGGVDETLVKFLENIAYYSLLAVVVIAALNKLGVETTSFLAILGAAGLAVGLALKDSLGNFASGVMIVLFKPFKAGDSVVAGGVSGTVVEITIFNTIFLTGDNQKIIVPNSKITSGSITNVNANDSRKIDITVAISYENSIKQAKDVLVNIVEQNPKVLKDKGFGISVSDLALDSIKLSLGVWVKSSDFGSLRSELLEEIKTKFDEAGVVIAYQKNISQTNI